MAEGLQKFQEPGVVIKSENLERARENEAFEDFAKRAGLTPENIHTTNRKKGTQLEKWQQENWTIVRGAWKGYGLKKIAEELGWQGKNANNRVNMRLSRMGCGSPEDRFEWQKTNPRIKKLVDELKKLNQRGRGTGVKFSFSKEILDVVNELTTTTQITQTKIASILGCNYQSLHAAIATEKKRGFKEKYEQQDQFLEKLVWEGVPYKKIPFLIDIKPGTLDYRLKRVDLDTREARIEWQKENPRIKPLFDELERMASQAQESNFDFASNEKNIKTIHELIETTDIKIKTVVSSLRTTRGALRKALQAYKEKIRVEKSEKSFEQEVWGSITPERVMKELGVSEEEAYQRLRAAGLIAKKEELQKETLTHRRAA